jgi:hypothetical protein
VSILFAIVDHLADGDRYYSLVLGDLTGDSKLDVVVANYGDENVSVLLGDGTGSFGAAANFSVGTLGPLVSVSVFTGDFDSDGDLDLATANTDLTTFSSSNISILSANGDGTFNTVNNSIMLFLKLDYLRPHLETSTVMGSQTYQEEGHLHLAKMMFRCSWAIMMVVLIPLLSHTQSVRLPAHLLSVTSKKMDGQIWH